MYTYREGCIYKDGKWSFADMENDTIIEALARSRYLLVTINIVGGEIGILKPKDFFKIADKAQTVGEYIRHYTDVLPILESDLEIRSSKYRDLDSVERIGNDYLLKENLPFVLHSTGIWGVDNKLVGAIDVAVASTNDPVIGTFDVGLPFIKRFLKKEDITRKSGYIPKIFNLSTTLLVFGNSILKASSLFNDIGDAYVYTQVFRNVITDLYIDNLDVIPPTMVGLDPLCLPRDMFDNDDILGSVLAHPTVYFIDYQHPYPLGLETVSSSGGIIADYSDDLIMLGTKPSTLKVLHTVDRFTIPTAIKPVDMRYYKNSSEVKLASNDTILTAVQGTLFSLDYPYFTEKE